MEKGKLLNIDIIRAIAAIMIVLVHLEIFGWGGHGVELFLLITGYTSFLSIDRHKDTSPMPYYKRRLLKILPSYYGVVVIYFFIYLVILGERYEWTQIVKSLVKYFTLTTTLFPRDLLFWFYLGTTGTIVSIMLFYLMVPFLYRFVNSFKRSLYAIGISFVACHVWIKLLEKIYEGTEYAGRHPVYTIYLAFFGVAAYFAVKEKKIFEYILFLMLTGVACLVGNISNDKLYWIIMFTTILVVTMDIEEKLPKNKLVEIGVKGIRFVARYSYALYLGHPIGILIMKTLINKETTTLPMPIYWAIELVFFVIMTFLVYQLFEKPFSKASKRKLQKI